MEDKTVILGSEWLTAVFKLKYHLVCEPILYEPFKFGKNTWDLMIDLTEVMNAISGCSGKIYSQMRKVSRGFTEGLRNP